MARNIEAEIRKAEQAQLEAARRGDGAAFAHHFHQDMDVFWHDGRPLIQAPECQAALQMPLDQAFRMDFRYEDLRIRLVADTVAVLTGNLAGTVQQPDGNKFDMGFRLTSIRVKEGDDWKIVHWHESPMQSET